MRLTDLVSSGLQVVGLAAVVYGIDLVYTPAAYIAGGVFAVVASLGLDRMVRRSA